MGAKQLMDELLEIQEKLSKFHDLKITPQVRKDLSTFLKSLTEEHSFIRDDEGKVVRLWTSRYYKENGMSSDIEIYRTNDTIYVCDDSLWRTIEGLNERVRGD